MLLQNRFLPGILSASLLLITACHKDEDRSKLTAAAGTDQNVLVGQVVTLNGNGSSDSRGNNFTFSWRLLSVPSSSTAVLHNEDTSTPDFTADLPGKYKVEVTVSNNSSSRDTVTVAAFKVKTLGGTYDNIIPGSNVGIRDFASVPDTLFATCEFTVIGGIQANKIAGFDGLHWFAMGCGLEDGSIYDMMSYKGELYVTGQFDEIGCIPAHNIARWDGKNWKDVEGGLTGGDNAFGYALAVYKNELYAGGLFTKAGDVDAVNIARWDGSKWAAAGTFGGGSVRELAVYKQKLYAGGFFTSVNGISTGHISTWDGNEWSALGPMNGLELGSTGTVKHMAVFNDKLYLSGDFTDDADRDLSELVVWDGSQFSDFGRAFSLYPDNTISELQVAGNKLYIGGEFHSVIGTQAGSILQWDGESWGKPGSGISGTVLSIEEFKGQIYIGGDFDVAGGQTSENISIWTEN